MSRSEMMNANANDVSVKELLIQLSQMSGESQPTQKHQIKDALKEWETFLRTEDDKSNSTVRGYESSIRLFSDYNKTRFVEDVTKNDIVEYRNHLQSRGLKPTTVNTHLIALNLFFEYCVDEEICRANPSRRVKKVKNDQLRPRSLDDSTVNRLRNFIRLNCEKRNDYTHLMIFDFMLKLGLRVGEVTSLRFNDIDTETGDVRVQGKGNKIRFVCMPDDLLADYKRYKSSLHRSKNESQFCFMHHGQTYCDTAVRTFYWRLCREHGITHVSPHQLRHTYAIRKMESGVPHTIIQNDMGHASFSTTARYAMPSLNDKRKYANH